MKEKETIETLVPAKYDTNLAQIAKLKDEYMPLVITDLEDHEQFQAVHDARMVMVKVRTAIDKRRKANNESARKYIQDNDNAAKELLNAAAPVEEHLQAEEKKVTDEKKRIEEEERQKFTLMVNARVATLHKYQAVYPFDEIARMDDTEFDATLAMAKEAYKKEQDRKAVEEAERVARQAELDRIAEEQAKRDKEQAEKEEALRREREAFEREKREAKEKAEREAFQRQVIENARIKAEQEAREKVEREKREAEEAERKAREEEEADRAEAARRAALLPDKEKLIAWAEAVEKAVPVTLELESKEANGIFIDAIEVISDIIEQVKKQAREM